MNEILIGRKKEVELLENIAKSNTSELVAILGRRRIGKTFLIHSVYSSNILFEISGVHKTNLITQLNNFNSACLKYFGLKKTPHIPENWMEAFQQLEYLLNTIKSKQKRILFFDEFPWMETQRSGFITAFAHFWNTYAARQGNIVIIICGSSASWMIQKVLNNKGGLHNRVTQRLILEPFTLKESQEYLFRKKIILSNDDLLRLYMIIGGVPYYLSKVEKGKSVNQIIDSLCFSNTGILRDEFHNLYEALFDNAQNHIAIIKVLVVKNKGLTRDEILAATKIASGGTTSRLFEELEQSSFIKSYIPYGKKKKDTLYRLIDYYSIFYLKFMKSHLKNGNGSFNFISQMQSYKSWCGYAFENICMQHTNELKAALGITGVYTEQYSWYKKADNKTDGAQIDLIIDRNDKCINLIEIKYSNKTLLIDKALCNAIHKKKKIFVDTNNIKKTIFTNVISSQGYKYSNNLPTSIDEVFGVDIFFR